MPRRLKKKRNDAASRVKRKLRGQGGGRWQSDLFSTGAKKWPATVYAASSRVEFIIAALNLDFSISDFRLVVVLVEFLLGKNKLLVVFGLGCVRQVPGQNTKVENRNRSTISYGNVIASAPQSVARAKMPVAEVAVGYNELAELSTFGSNL